MVIGGDKDCESELNYETQFDTQTDNHAIRLSCVLTSFSDLMVRQFCPVELNVSIPISRHQPSSSASSFVNVIFLRSRTMLAKRAPIPPRSTISASHTSAIQDARSESESYRN